MTSSAAPSYATIRSNTLGSRELSSCSRSLRIGVRAPRSRTGRKRSRGGNATAPRPQDPTTAGASALVRAARERVGGGLRAADDGVDARLALQRALDRLLYRPVVEVEDFLVVLRLPVDEDAHQDAVVVHLVARAVVDSVSSGVIPRDKVDDYCTAWVAPLMVTLLKRSASGLAGRFGLTTAKPDALLFNKVTIKGATQAVQMFGPALAAVARAVVDSVSSGVIPRDKVDDYCILVGVFIHWQAKNDKKIFDFNYRAVKESIERALKGQPRVDAVISGAKTATHPFAGGADKS